MVGLAGFGGFALLFVVVQGRRLVRFWSVKAGESGIGILWW